MYIKELWKESNDLINDAIAEDDIEKIKVLNIKLIQKLQKIGINNLHLTSLGNSIALGHSKEGIIESVFNRNDSLDKVSEYYNFGVKKYVVASDSKYNNIHKWLLENIHLDDINIINSAILNKEDKTIRDIIENTDSGVANIIIYNGCSIRRKYTLDSFKKDLSVLDMFLTSVEESNRKYNSNTQVYVSGIPNITIVNGSIKEKVNKHANANYIKPVDCDMFDNGKLNFKYTEQQYRRYNMNIIKSIDENYLFTEALIDIDRNNNNIEVINKWLDLLKKNHCDLKKFKERLNQLNTKRLIRK